ncbi:putative translation initiation factor IF-1 [Candidatus Hodgkinia cicadicola Dsem]|nr:putative translation initiation factor IF-1 [Candidatus Hodgkinia cicadicola Dsem]
MAPTLASTGVVVEALPSASFGVKLDGGGRVVAYLAGKLKAARTKVRVGDRVLVEVAARAGRIVFKYKL